MEPFYADFINLFTPMHASLKKAVTGLPQEALDWSPGPDENSIAVLAAHVSGANLYFIRDVILREPTGRDRDSEFRTSSLDETALLERLERSYQAVADTLPTLTMADLQSERILPRSGRTITVGWTLMHLLEHTALHIGHMEMTRSVWEARQSGGGVSSFTTTV